MKEMLENMEFNCTCCGLCCPNLCIHKNSGACKLEILNSKTEVPRAHPFCYLGPVELFFHGIYCPQVVSVVEQLTDLKVVPIIGPGGGVGVANLKRLMAVLEKVKPWEMTPRSS